MSSWSQDRIFFETLDTSLVNLSLFEEALVLFVLCDEFTRILFEVFFVEDLWKIVDYPLTIIVKEVIFDSF